jgi:hypothetical protein
MSHKDFMDQQDAIQKAYRAGKRTVTIEGVKYNIVKFTRNASFTVGGETKRRKESWLRANRADGQLTPVFVVEMSAQSNLRSKA